MTCDICAKFDDIKGRVISGFVRFSVSFMRYIKPESECFDQYQIRGVGHVGFPARLNTTSSVNNINSQTINHASHQIYVKTKKNCRQIHAN